MKQKKIFLLGDFSLKKINNFFILFEEIQKDWDNNKIIPGRFMWYPINVMGDIPSKKIEVVETINPDLYIGAEISKIKEDFNIKIEVLNHDAETILSILAPVNPQKIDSYRVTELLINLLCTEACEKLKRLVE